MTITAEIKQMVVDTLFQDMKDRGIESQAEYARYIKALLSVPFDKAALSSIKKPEKRNMLKDSTWLKLATHFNLLSDGSWNIAPTHGYITMTTYLNTCKKHGLWKVVCDHASFGKTTAAMDFCNKHKDTAFYIDCSEYTTKGDFITALARQFGLERTGTFNQLWQDVTDELLLLDKPLLVLDEFGDVHDSIITLLKSLYNKANRGDHVALGVLHIGADNLKKRMIDGKRKQKQSYAEYWSRIGDDLLTLNFHNPEKPKQAAKLLESDAEKILELNMPESLAEYKDDILKKVVCMRNLRIIREQINIKADLKNLSN
ncbi:AAA family ATPase [Dysgonomonas sp. 520]|uniref:AAA family ATPase n=1 Tax=Dysgonomonas sp. 520 TaxID=2302931 RepID=UPI0013D35E0E|nr:AAA family ATPase [Dysgonomonas sp. 520]NDW10928.1 hypothetical protein [Dysgonomonas sp. 520]